MIRDFGHEVSQEEKDRFSKYGSQESYQAISMYFGALIGAQNMNDILTKENLQVTLSEPKSIDGCHILTAKDATSGTEVMKASIDRYVLSSEEFLDIVTGKATATIFHHVDMDGYASAAVVYNMFNSLQSNPENVFLCSYNYKGDYIRKTVERSNMYTDHNKKKYAFVVDLALTPDDMIYIAEIDSAPCAFIVGLPNINEAIADLNGSLFPFGWAKLLWRLKVSGVRTARVPLMGVRDEYQFSRIGPVIALLLIEALRDPFARRKIDALEMSWILETNTGMNNMLERIGAEPYKRYRLYEKQI